MSTEFLLFLSTLLIGLYVWHKRIFTYWERKHVRHFKPTPIFGNLKSVLTGKKTLFNELADMYNAPGYEKEAVVGFYLAHRPALLIRDLELIKTIMIKKFNHFTNHVVQTDPYNDPLGHHNLFFSRGSQWKDLRSKISPVFTSGKIKQMYPLMVEIGKNLEKKLSSFQNQTNLSIRDVCARFTTELIATIAFGIKIDALENEECVFYRKTQDMTKITFRRIIEIVVIFILPSFKTLARVKFFSKSLSDFMIETMTSVLKEREASGTKRNDLVDILIAMKHAADKEPEKENLSNNLEFLIAQAAVFQAAGFETSSSTMTFALYELAKHQEMQDRLRNEISEYFGNEDHISYERIQEMPYLAQVVNETLRKYPILGDLERECTPPANEPPFKLTPYYDFQVPAGMPIYIPAIAIQRDEKYWPEPLKFDPERFAPENKANLNMDAYMPFGIGSRNCIGLRLGLLKTKLGLVHMLRSHQYSTISNTPAEITFDAQHPTLFSDIDICLKVTKLAA